mmetsp:Transcript_89126/g.230023  ORF Transcript_89126/g.230023 Transcript_89126/m.230023 type:complete len:519 (-) Transcript_89126:77-1633(-)
MKAEEGFAGLRLPIPDAPLLGGGAKQAPNIWQKLSVALLAVIALGAVHVLFYQLHDILVPFFLSGFIVFALQPSVEYLYCLLAGLAPPYRWCILCCRRRSKAVELAERKDDGASSYACCFGGDAARLAKEEEEARLEAEPLLEAMPTFASMLADSLLRFVAVTVVLLSLLFLASFFFYLLGHGAMQLKDNWQAYRDGLQRLQKMQDDFVDAAARELNMKDSVDIRVKEAYDEILKKAQHIIWHVVNDIVTGVTEGLSSILIMLLYVLFWLLQPLPTSGGVSAVVRSYLWKKACVSFLYGSCVTLLFYVLSIDLAIFFGVISFFLNFVPEVGAFISMIIPVPVIMLDGRMKNPAFVLLASLVGQMFLKFLYSNILEVKLIERDKEMNIHPVWVIAGLSYFGYIWGPLGALLSVPMLAMVKMAALAALGDTQGDRASRDEIVSVMAEMFLACFEGRPYTDCGGKDQKSPHSSPRMPQLRPPGSASSESGAHYPAPVSPQDPSPASAMKSSSGWPTGPMLP